MWPSAGGRGRLGGATTDENMCPAATTHGAPTGLHKPAAAGAGSGASMTPGNGAKAAARKALGPLGSGNSQNVMEDQARIKMQGLLGGGGGGGVGKDVGGGSARPRRALGEITNRVAPLPSSASSKNAGGAPHPTKPSTGSSSLFGSKGGGVKMAPPSAVPATALADLPSFSDDEDEVEDVEMPAGRLGEEEERLVAKKRAAKEAEEDADFLHTVNRLLLRGGDADEEEEEEEEEPDWGMIEDAPAAEDDALPPKENDDGVSSLGSVLDDLDLLVDF